MHNDHYLEVLTLDTKGPLAEQTIDNIKQVFDTNTFSILRVCKAVVPIMAKRRSGTIVNIGSIVGEMYVVFFFFFLKSVYYKLC